MAVRSATTGDRPVPAVPTKHLALIRLWTGRLLRLRYRRTSLGFLWIVAQPVATLLVYGLLFRVLLRVTPDDLPYLSFAWAGLVPWMFFSNSLREAFRSIVGSASILTGVAVPKQVVPLSAVLAVGVDLLVGTAILFLVALVQGISPSPTILALILIYSVLFVWTVGIGVLGATFSVYVGDLLQALPIALQLVFVTTPIMYPRELIPPSLTWILDLNPLAVVIEATRDVALRNEWPDWELLFIHGVVGAAVLIGAFLLLHSLAARIVDEL